MHHEAVFILTSQRVDALGIALGTQSGDHQSLGFTAREQGRTVGARQHAVADFDRTHRACVTAVDTWLACQDLAANDVRFDVEQHAFDFHRIKLNTVGLEGCHCASVGLAACERTGLLVTVLIGGAQIFFCVCLDLGNQRLILGWRSPIPSWFASVAHQVVNGVDRDVALLVAKHHSTQHDLF